MNTMCFPQEIIPLTIMCLVMFGLVIVGITPILMLLASICGLIAACFQWAYWMAVELIWGKDE